MEGERPERRPTTKGKKNENLDQTLKEKRNPTKKSSEQWHRGNRTTKTGPTEKQIDLDEKGDIPPIDWCCSKSLRVTTKKKN